ncbi:MAG: hypothetical protein K1V87_04560 [Muribaculum sp.]
MTIKDLRDSFIKSLNTGVALLKQLSTIENFYFKFILTVISITLIVIAIELDDKNFYATVDIIHGDVRVDGTMDVTGEMNTYEQNNVIGRHF